MIRLPTERLRLHNINGYTEAKARIHEPRIQGLAASIKQDGMIHFPTVRKVDMRLAAGRDRLAALIVLGIEVHECNMIGCTDAELQRIILAENAHRRHSPGEQASAIAALVGKLEAEIALEGNDIPDAPPMNVVSAQGERPPSVAPPRGKTNRGKARERAASTLGIKPESVRRAEIRAKKKDQATQEPLADFTFPAYGRPQEKRFLAGIKLAEQCINEAWSKAKLALGALKRLENSGTPYPTAAVQAMYERVQDLSNSIRDFKPYSVCPWCKQVPEITPHCQACIGQGWITVRQKASIPPELARGDDMLVAWNGAYVPLKKFVDDAPVEPPDLDEPSEEEISAALDANQHSIFEEDL